MTGTLHVTFSPSAAHSLRQAMARMGRLDRVIGLEDYLNYGPIDPVISSVRAKWVAKVLDQPERGEAFELADEFWRAALSPGMRRVVWFCRRCAREYCGLLEFVKRIGDQPFAVVDMTNVLMTQTARPLRQPKQTIYNSVAVIPDEEFASNNLIDLARALTTAEAAYYSSCWTKLRKENAPLRVLNSNFELESADITYFDEQLISHAAQDWRRGAYIAGSVLAVDDERYQIDDLFLISRLKTLSASGRLEGRGNLYVLRESEFRLPRVQAS